MAAGWNSQPLESSVHAPKTLDDGAEAATGDWSARGATAVLPAARYKEDASSAKGFSKRSDIWDLRVG